MSPVGYRHLFCTLSPQSKSSERAVVDNAATEDDPAYTVMSGEWADTRAEEAAEIYKQSPKPKPAPAPAPAPPPPPPRPRHCLRCIHAEETACNITSRLIDSVGTYGTHILHLQQVLARLEERINAIADNIARLEERIKNMVIYIKVYPTATAPEPQSPTRSCEAHYAVPRPPSYDNANNIYGSSSNVGTGFM